MNTAAQTATTTRPSDEHLAEAYRRLEGAIGDLRDMSLVMETIAENAIGRRGGEFETAIKRKLPGYAGYRIYVLTEEQEQGLDFVIRLMGDHCRDLHTAYFAGYRGGERAA